ncbi:MAG: hypothetical protein P8J87_07910 [Verrucomicrobiales bacterium]|nr:hypothetical protein [Verrucomicrobiales bacterium]
MPNKLALLLFSPALAQALEVTTLVESTPDQPIDNPFAAEYHTDGSLYFVTYGGDRVFKLSPTGQLTHLAGKFRQHGYSGDGGHATAATFNRLHNLAISADGKIYLSDTFNHSGRLLDPESGLISSFAGNGSKGFKGKTGDAKKAIFNEFYCVTFDKDRRHLFVTDLKNQLVRSIDTSTGKIHTVAGNRKKAHPINGKKATGQPMLDPRAAAPDHHGNLYILSRGGHSLYRVDPDGNISTVAGTGNKGQSDGPALGSAMNGPKHLCVDPEDGKKMLIVDTENDRIVLFDPDKATLTTVLGGNKKIGATTLARPHGVYVHSDGSMVVADSENHRIIKVTGWRP